MDDHSSSVQPVRPRRHGQRRLDTVTRRLKAEFAKIARERLLAYMPRVTAADLDKSRRAEPAMERYDLPNGITVFSRLVGFYGMGRERLRALDEVLSEAGQPEHDSPLYGFRKRILALFRIILALVIKLQALSLRAALTVPLFLDGPEMNGFKHRLR